jgi:tetratricopeptide (TPR) repeat protein
MTPFVLARSAISGSPAAAPRRAYKVGTTQLTPDPGLTFHVGESLYLFYQVLGLSPELKESGVIRTTVGKPGTRGTATRKTVKEAGGGPDFLETIPLDATPAGTYVVAVELLDAEGRPQASGAASFKVSSTGLPGFWVYGPSNPGPEDPSHDYRLGTQFLVVGDAGEAREALARAHAKAPQSLEYGTAYGRALLAAGDAAKALEILRPFAAEAGNYDLFAVAGRAAQATGDLKAAVGYYGKALAARGRMTDILNALGECHLGLGDKTLAEKAWRESLAVNPGQEEIRARLANLKN